MEAGEGPGQASDHEDQRNPRQNHEPPPPSAQAAPKQLRPQRAHQRQQQAGQAKRPPGKLGETDQGNILPDPGGRRCVEEDHQSNGDRQRDHQRAKTAMPRAKAEDGSEGSQDELEPAEADGQGLILLRRVGGMWQGKHLRKRAQMARGINMPELLGD